MVGLGGLGCPAALYLAAAGVGHLGLIDDDCVSLSNLQRQILYSVSDLGKPKAFVARQRLLALNPRIDIDAREERFSELNAESLLSAYDLVVDATDNFPTRYLLSDFCRKFKKPLVYGSIFRFEGQVSVFGPDGPCYRCLYPVPPDAAASLSCEQAGVLGVLPGLVGSIQAAEALKWILKIGDSLGGRILMIDSLTMSFDSFKLPQRSDCPACGSSAGAMRLSLTHEPSAHEHEITAQELKRRLGQVIVLDLRESEAFAQSHIPGAHRIEASAKTIAQLERDWGLNEALVVYCKSGARSRYFVSELRDHGFEKARHLQGGYMGWLTPLKQPPR
jgi:adenylyltransferase/sulfurtransferase